jgi:Rps23 Pro-64 3,4-dihydroxylase Tpa1-like proline 4-hydroxylase
MRLAQLENGKVVKRKELAPGIVVYEDVMQGHDTFIKDIEDVVESGHVVWQDSYVNVGSESKKDSSIRDTQSLSISYEVKDDQGLIAYFQQSVRELFFNSFDHLEKEYMSSFGINCPDHDQYQILKYGVGQKFVNHIDDGPIHHRRVSTVYYVNDNYEGGEILFPRFGLSYKPKANELLVFPSTYVYNHSVRPVLSGTRYAVVSWMK